MFFSVFKNTVLLFVFILISCASKTKDLSSNKDGTFLQEQQDIDNTTGSNIIVGANQVGDYLPWLQGKRVGIVANQTSVIFKRINKQMDTTFLKSQNAGFVHLVDSLISLKINLKKVFAPEHGFRGALDAGQAVKDGIDTQTGLPIISLYGKNKKPSKTQLSDIDVMIFDIQDVGARFYTYISTLHYVMEACAEQNIKLLILDRPNPNGHYIDGPILELEHKSFVGMHPVPVVHGMTIGEYAKMINGEKWLKNGIECAITIIPVRNYSHQTKYSVPIKPSPNLPNDTAINLYPSLCFFEGTNISAGRGTMKQFQIFGSPFLNPKIVSYNYTFTPQLNEGSKHPKHENKLCFGMDLSETKRLDGLDLNYLIEAYWATDHKNSFFNDFFTKLAGTKTLQEQIESKLTALQLKTNWTPGLKKYDAMRQRYLLYN